MKKLLITGATGMIGSAIVRQALKQDYDVTCIVRENSNRENNLPEDRYCHIVVCNSDAYATVSLSGTYDVFIHLAWANTAGAGRDDVAVQFQNIQSTLDAVRLAFQCGCTVFIGAGSQAEYGVQEKSLTADMPVNPESCYGIAKYTAGKFAARLCEQLRIKFNWLRILSVYGPHDAPYTLISYVVSELKAGRSPELTRCEQIWDYLYCDDAAMAFLAVAEKGVSGKTYPLGSGTGRKLSEYMNMVRCIVNPDISLSFGKKQYYPHQPMYLVADITELSQDTGWKPEIEFQEGIKRIVGSADYL
ncbi:NAD-dependent epimerase/dehydratase [Treponema brennaborense DSM 12168]|uniref:NAD-dependent epimerase/dehydratase n=2 Tax=Treponema TaxID=157 RepID=F4LIS5_TREBD|nr:NAD-dependent epimerase/dehydratase [Treponema brennaborense DSM 12168]